MNANVLFFDNRTASKTVATKEVWYYDYRTNIHHTLKHKPLRFDDLREFIKCYNPTQHPKRKATWNAESNPEGPGGNTPTPNSPPAIKPVSTYFGSRMTASQI